MNSRAVAQAIAGLTAGLMLVASGASFSADFTTAAVSFRPAEAMRAVKKNNTAFQKKQRREASEAASSSSVASKLSTKSVACETMTDVYGEMSAAITPLQITDAEGEVTNPAAPLKTVLDDLLAKYCKKESSK